MSNNYTLLDYIVSWPYPIVLSYNAKDKHKGDIAHFIHIEHMVFAFLQTYVFYAWQLDQFEWYS